MEPHHLVPLIEDELVAPPGTVDAFLIDERGKMDCLCPEFIEAVRRILDGPVPWVATVAFCGSGIIAEVKRRPKNLHIPAVPRGSLDRRMITPGRFDDHDQIRELMASHGLADLSNGPIERIAAVVQDGGAIKILPWKSVSIHLELALRNPRRQWA